MKSKKRWVLLPEKNPKIIPSELEKKIVQDFFQPFVESLKKQYVLKKPDKKFNYLVDVYSKWYQNYFYLCEKFKSECPSRIVDEYEEKFVRLTYTGKNLFDFSFLRHTGQWHVVATKLTMNECKKEISSNQVFHPIS